MGLAEVIDARETSLGGPRSERDKLAQTWSCGWCLWFVILQVFQADVPGGNWVTVGFNPPGPNFKGDVAL